MIPLIVARFGSNQKSFDPIFQVSWTFFSPQPEKYMISEGPSQQQLLFSFPPVLLLFHEGNGNLQLNSAALEAEIANASFLLPTYLIQGEGKASTQDVTKRHRNCNPVEILLLEAAYCYNLRSKTCIANGVL